MSEEVAWTDDLEIEPAKFDVDQGHILSWDDQKQKYHKRLRHHSTLKIPHLIELEPRQGTCTIVGSAPTVVDYLDEIRECRPTPYDLLATLNGAHGLLIRNGIVPNIHLLAEYDAENIDVMGSEPHKDVRYYICSHCSVDVSDALKEYHRVLWHCFLGEPEYQGWIQEFYPDEFMVGGATATLFRTVNVAAILGFRKFDIYGCDSSFEVGGDSHFPDYPVPSPEKRIEVWGYNPNGHRVRKFHTTGSLAFTAKLFIEFCKEWQPKLEIRVHGKGLLHYLHKSRYPYLYAQDT